MSYPKLNPKWILREKTVEQFYDFIYTNDWDWRLFMIRGPPGSGKTTFLTLLYHHIAEHHPNDNIYYLPKWPTPTDTTKSVQTIEFDLVDYFRHPQRSEYCKRNSWWLIDEAQILYSRPSMIINLQDSLSKFPKESTARVVLACNYGGASETVSMGSGIPFSLNLNCRLQMTPVDKGEYSLLLDKEELEELVEIHHKLTKCPKLHPNLVEEVMGWTNGHVGVIVALLELITAKGREHYQTSKHFTEQDLWKIVSETKAPLTLRENNAFRNGLPDELAFKDPFKLRILYDLIHERRIMADTIDRHSMLWAAMEECHQNGWLYEIIDNHPNDPRGEYVYYVPASPLHLSYISMKLEECVNMDQSREEIATFQESGN